MTNEIEAFKAEVAGNIAGLKQDRDVQALSRIWLREITRHRYAYNFSWLGRPLIQFPQDMAAIQELVWRTRPDLVIEAGIAHGGSLILSASMLALLDYCEAIETGGVLNPAASKRRVIGIDVDIRSHNRAAIEAHPLSCHIDMIEGSSIAPDTIAEVRGRATGHERIMVILDSNHTHDHVLAELEAYAPLVSPDCYCVVLDTVIEDLPAELGQDRPWGVGNNPRTAVREYLSRRDDFVVDEDMEAKLLITVAPGGYLRRTGG